VLVVQVIFQLAEKQHLSSKEIFSCVPLPMQVLRSAVCLSICAQHNSWTLRWMSTKHGGNCYEVVKFWCSISGLASWITL